MNTRRDRAWCVAKLGAVAGAALYAAMAVGFILFGIATFGLPVALALLPLVLAGVYWGWLGSFVAGSLVTIFLAWALAPTGVLIFLILLVLPSVIHAGLVGRMLDGGRIRDLAVAVLVVSAVSLAGAAIVVGAIGSIDVLAMIFGFVYIFVMSWFVDLLAVLIVRYGLRLGRTRQSTL